MISRNRRELSSLQSLTSDINSINYGFESVVRDSLILDGDIKVSDEERDLALGRMKSSERARSLSRRDYLDYEI